jgi:hypothetical protein
MELSDEVFFGEIGRDSKLHHSFCGFDTFQFHNNGCQNHLQHASSIHQLHLLFYSDQLNDPKKCDYDSLSSVFTGIYISVLLLSP